MDAKSPLRGSLLRANLHASRTVRRWALHHRSDKSLQDLDEIYNPCIRGWINYYSHFYKTQLRPTLKRIDLYVIRWARRKFKRLRRKTKGRETGLTGYTEQIQRSLPTGGSAMETAEHREPYESRGSRTDLGAPGGETSPGDSTIPVHGGSESFRFPPKAAI